MQPLSIYYTSKRCLFDQPPWNTILCCSQTPTVCTPFLLFDSTIETCGVTLPIWSIPILKSFWGFYCSHHPGQPGLRSGAQRRRYTSHLVAPLGLAMAFIVAAPSVRLRYYIHTKTPGSSIHFWFRSSHATAATANVSVVYCFDLWKQRYGSTEVHNSEPKASRTMSYLLLREF